MDDIINLPLGHASQSYTMPFLSFIGTEICQGTRDAGVGGAGKSSRGKTCKNILTESYSGTDFPMLKSVFQHNNSTRSVVEDFFYILEVPRVVFFIGEG